MPVEQRLSEIGLPTLVIHGRRDVITPIAAAQNLVAQVPNSKLVVIDGAGHVPMLTRPHEVAHAIDEFFASFRFRDWTLPSPPVN